eukprot:6194509-Pleurochrysis_carterae.AAC.2
MSRNAEFTCYARVELLTEHSGTRIACAHGMHGEGPGCSPSPSGSAAAKAQGRLRETVDGGAEYQLHSLHPIVISGLSGFLLGRVLARQGIVRSWVDRFRLWRSNAWARRQDAGRGSSTSAHRRGSNTQSRIAWGWTEEDFQAYMRAEAESGQEAAGFQGSGAAEWADWLHRTATDKEDVARAAQRAAERERNGAERRRRAQHAQQQYQQQQQYRQQRHSHHYHDHYSHTNEMTAFRALLGVTPMANPSELKEAYRRMAMLHHPDLNREDPKAACKFAQVQHAYEALQAGRK